MSKSEFAHNRGHDDTRDPDGAALSDNEQGQQRRINLLLALWKSESLRLRPLADVLQAITSAATEILEVGRVGVWVFSDDRSCIECLDLFEISTLSHSSGLVVDSITYPNYFRALEENRAIAADDAHTDSRTKELSETYLSAMGVTSLLDAPIRGAQGLRGVLCHEHVGPPRHWTAADQMLAASLADLVSVVFEADQRARAEAAQRESEQRSRSLFEDSPDAILVENLDGYVIDANPAACKLYAMSQEQIVGKHFLERVPPDQREEVTEQFHALSNGELPEFESYCWTSDEREVPVEITASQIVYGGQEALLLHLRDITSRKQAQEALWRSENRYRDLVETSHDLIWSVDVHGCWTFVNAQAAKSIYGYEPRELLGHPFTELHHPEFPNRDWEVFTSVLAGQSAHHYETIHRRRNGEAVHLSVNAIPQYNGQGKVIGATGSAIDITLEKRSEEELSRQRENLAHIARLNTLGQMVAGLAHELAQPLSAIANYVAAFKSRIERTPAAADSELVEMIVLASLQVTRAGDIMRQLRGSVRGANPACASIDFNRVINETLKLLSAEISRHSVQVATELPDPDPVVWADRVQLQQVLVNLIKNAIESMLDQPRESRQLSIRTWSDDKIHVVIRDTGTGIDEDQLERCFETFYTTKSTGMGMGLAICQSIVAEHGGRIWMERNTAGGTDARFTLRQSEPDN